MRRNLQIVAIVCGLLAVTGAGGCARAPQPTGVGGAVGTKSEKARKQAEELSLNVVNGAVKAQVKAIESMRSGQPSKSTAIASNGFSHVTVISPSSNVTETQSPVPTPPAPTSSSPQMTAVKDFTHSKSSPRPGSPAVIKEHVVSSIPSASEAEAEEDAFTNARDVIERRLAELDPPVRYRPSLNEIKNEFARKDSRTIHRPAQAELDEYAKSFRPDVVEKLVCAEYDVEVTADQIRELRTRDRVTITLRVFSGLIFIALAGFLFLRADEWTKGYLTRWLACAAVILVGGAAAALYFV